MNNTRVSVIATINKTENKRLELAFVNFECYDGNDLIAKLLHEQCGVEVGRKVEGIFSSILPLHDNSNEYKLVWHEDIGNYIYSESQDQESIARMHELVAVAVNELNSTLYHSP